MRDVGVCRTPRARAVAVVPNGRTTVDYDLLVIGAGTAGIFAARTAVGLGARTAIAEQDGFATTCLGTG